MLDVIPHNRETPKDFKGAGHRRGNPREASRVPMRTKAPERAITLWMVPDPMPSRVASAKSRETKFSSETNSRIVGRNRRSKIETRRERVAGRAGEGGCAIGRR